MTGRQERLLVAPETVPCDAGAGPQDCLKVRRGPDADWELFYDDIAGFTFEPGHTYELLVEITDVASPAADAGALHYTLVEVVDRRPAD